MPSNDPVQFTIGVGAFIRTIVHQTSAILFGSKCGSIYHFFPQVTLLDHRRPIRWISPEEIDRKVIFGSLPVIRTSRLDLTMESDSFTYSASKMGPQYHHLLNFHINKAQRDTCHGGEGFPLSTSRSTITLLTVPRSQQHLPAHLRTPIEFTATFQPNRDGKDNSDAVKKIAIFCTPCGFEFILNSAGSMLTPTLTFYKF